MSDDIFDLPDDPLPPHPYTERDDICGVTKTGATGIEWICIKEVHATEADIKAGRKRIDQHWFVRRWPNRHEEE